MLCMGPLHYVNMGFYTRQVEAYMERFSRVSIHLFDEFRADTKGEMRRLFEFLGVDPDVELGESEDYNVSGMPKNRLLQRLLFHPTPAKLYLKSLLVKSVFTEEQVVNVIERLRRRNLKKVQMQPATRRRLLDLYRPDIESLQDLIGRDLSHWLE